MENLAFLHQKVSSVPEGNQPKDEASAKDCRAERRKEGVSLVSHRSY